MGLHTGEPTVGEEGYLGMDVVRAARICSAGHGGQILLSETTRALVGNSIPEGTEVRDLGEANLKDVQHERIFELALAGQEDAFPPLKTAAPPSSADVRRRDRAQGPRADPGRLRAGLPDDSTEKLGKLVLVGFLALFLCLAALAAIFLLVRAVL